MFLRSQQESANQKLSFLSHRSYFAPADEVQSIHRFCRRSNKFDEFPGRISDTYEDRFPVAWAACRPIWKAWPFESLSLWRGFRTPCAESARTNLASARLRHNLRATLTRCNASTQTGFHDSLAGIHHAGPPAQ